MCPYCNYAQTRVLDTRAQGKLVRRKRQCERCQGRFSTDELVIPDKLYVRKRRGRTEEFSVVKLRMSLFRACPSKQFRSLPEQAALVDKVLGEVVSGLMKLEHGIASSTIRDLVAKELKKEKPLFCLLYCLPYSGVDSWFVSEGIVNLHADALIDRIK